MGIFGRSARNEAISTIAALAVTACLLAVGAAARPAAPSPQSYYLALGDSVAYGAQPAKMQRGAAAVRVRHGLRRRLRRPAARRRPEIQVVNYSCPGESTRTFVDGGCSGRET